MKVTTEVSYEERVGVTYIRKMRLNRMEVEWKRGGETGVTGSGSMREQSCIGQGSVREENSLQLVLKRWGGDSL